MDGVSFWSARVVPRPTARVIGSGAGTFRESLASRSRSACATRGHSPRRRNSAPTRPLPEHQPPARRSPALTAAASRRRRDLNIARVVGVVVGITALVASVALRHPHLRCHAPTRRRRAMRRRRAAAQDDAGDVGRVSLLWFLVRTIVTSAVFVSGQRPISILLRIFEADYGAGARTGLL